MNELLLWLSARKHGSAQSFRSKVAELGLAGGRTPHRVVQWNLAKLAHAEFAPAAAGAGWRIAPPVLAAGDPWETPRAFLCGARTPEILDRLCALGAKVRHQNQNGGPDVIEIEAPSATSLEDYAASARVEVQWNASLALLACCTPPTLEQLVRVELPIGGWDVSRFSKTGLAWVPSSVDQARSAPAGLFRFRSDYETLHILIEGEAAFAVEPATGKYRILKKRHSPISYRSSQRALQIRASCRPPPLVERALVLCSGALPAIKDGSLTYSNVEPPIASAVASLLGQRLR